MGDVMNGDTARPEVLVVGGGSVGLAAAVMLAEQGLTVQVVERQAAPAIHPRAGGLGPRTLEIFRQLGLADRVRAAGDPPDAGVGRVRAETLLAAGLPDRPRAAATAIGDASKMFSPEGGVACAQDRLDAVLLDAARARGVRVTYGAVVRDLRQHSAGAEDGDRDGVTVVVEEAATGEVRTLTARDVLAADGASSGVRRQLGIGTNGPGPVGPRMVNVLFRADLRAIVGKPGPMMVQITHAESPGLLMSSGVADRWTFHITVGAADATDAIGARSGLTPERARALIGIAIGQPDIAVEILSMLPWTPAAQVAETFRRDDIFLVGDAAHVVPPLGAFGLNLGIADPHNLAWKLALVRRGIAGASLLDTYDTERRAAAQFTVDHALARIRNPEVHFDHLHLESPAFRAARERLGIAHPLIVHLGYRYASNAIIEPSPDLPSLEDPACALDGSPGSRLPHAWIAREGVTRSTLDLVRHRFTLLAGPRATRTCVEASAAASRWDLPLDVHQDLDADWLRSVGLDADGALLVRPDGFIAWRQPTQPAGGIGFDDLLETVLHRPVTV
jgi:2-polyprenyl-6-methoxyphenol hydroxylase-like FAD-dependent oxidoreductase